MYMVLGKKRWMVLGNSGTYLEVKMEPLEEDYYPISIRWFRRVGDKPKDIMKLRKFKLKEKDHWLLIGHKTSDDTNRTAHIISFELVDDPRKASIEEESETSEEENDAITHAAGE